MVTLRKIEEQELPGWVSAQNSAYFKHATRIEMIRQEAWFVPGELLGAYAGAECVGTFRSYSSEITVPGGNPVTATGITSVAVIPNHRRKGIMGAMMTDTLGRAAETGSSLAILVPTEYDLYGRYGFGPAVKTSSIQVKDPKSALLTVSKATTGKVVPLSGEEIRKIGPGVYDKFRRSQHGAMQRRPAWWSDLTDEWLVTRRMYQPFYAAYENSLGQVTGLVAYEVEPGFAENERLYSVKIRDHVFLEPKARSAIWNYIFSLDKVGSVKINSLPIGDPLYYLLRDPFSSPIDQHDLLWARILNLPDAVNQRTYSVDGFLTFSIDDRLGFCQGIWSISVKDGRGKVSRTSRKPDIEMKIEDFSSLYMGGGNVLGLHAAGRVAENKVGSAQLLHEMFRTPLAPWFPPNGLDITS